MLPAHRSGWVPVAVLEEMADRLDALFAPAVCAVERAAPGLGQASVLVARPLSRQRELVGDERLLRVDPRSAAGIAPSPVAVRLRLVVE
jgi:hypothetical protein